MRKIKNNPKILRILCCIILCVALMCALMELSNVSTSTSGSEKTNSIAYYGLAFLFVGIYELTFFLSLRKTTPRKIDFVRLGYVGICLVAMVFAFVGYGKQKLSVIAPALYLTIPVIKRIVALFGKRKAYSRVYNIMALIVCIIAELATFAVWVASDALDYDATPLFCCFAIILTCLVNICLMVFSQFNKEILLRIVRKTYAGEILLGLFLLIVAFSLVLMHNETGVHDFGDALWYCFAIVTTTGFGDIVATTMVGRILSVILGIYGIIAVAILTSIIVNFYNETKNVLSSKTEAIIDELSADTPEQEEEPEEEKPGEESNS